jgi:hypothetical protein
MRRMERFEEYYKARTVVVSESVRVARRSPKKYLKMVLGIWSMPLIIKGTTVMKDAYFFMRHVDDVLDGDLVLKEDPLDYVRDIRSDVAGECQSKNPICILARRSVEILDKRKKNGDSPRQDFLDGIDGMIGDYRRMNEREVLSGSDFRRAYIDSFGPHHNISMIMVGSDLRRKDIETFSYCQGLAYGLQDFDTDWERGLINIPKEVLKVSGLTVNHPISDIRSSPIVRDWVYSESEVSRANLADFLNDLNEMSNEKPAKLFLNSLSNRVVKILEKPIF